MWLEVNGVFRQKSSTANMIFDVPTLVSYVSQFMTQLSGDVISTGTPAGVGLGMIPPQYFKAGVVFGKVRIACIAEDALNKIEVPNEITGHEQARLHALPRSEAGDLRADDRTQEQRNETFSLVLLSAGEREAQQFAGRIERLAP